MTSYVNVGRPVEYLSAGALGAAGDILKCFLTLAIADRQTYRQTALQVFIGITRNPMPLILFTLRRIYFLRRDKMDTMYNYS